MFLIYKDTHIKIKIPYKVSEKENWNNLYVYNILVIIFQFQRWKR